MRAWLKRRWLSFQIRRIRNRLDDLSIAQHVLQLNLQAVDQELEGLAREWQQLRSKVGSLARPAAESAATIPPSSSTCAPRLRVVSMQKSGGSAQ
jgi:chromosome segregation ATPase